MRIWPPTRDSIQPIAIGLSVLAVYALVRQWFVPAGLLALAAAVFWIAPHNEKLMLFLTTPNRSKRSIILRLPKTPEMCENIQQTRKTEGELFEKTG